MIEKIAIDTTKITHFRLYSDLHIEFANFELSKLETDKTSLLILAGDIHVGVGARYFLAEVAERFAHVIYVFGNHEHYNGDVMTTESNLQEAISNPFFYDGLKDNVTLVSNKAKVIEVGGLRIVAATLWTDCNGNDPMTMLAIGDYLNDYHIVKKNGSRMIPSDTYDFYQEAISDFREIMSEPFDGKTIVVTHHAPCDEAIHDRYRGFRDAHLLAGGYRTRLNDFIAEFNPDYWVFGHTHEGCDIMIHNTRVMNNCRGYPQRGSSFSNPVFENSAFKDDFVISL